MTATLMTRDPLEAIFNGAPEFRIHVLIACHSIKSSTLAKRLRVWHNLMMIVEDWRDLLTHEPFEPLRIRLSSGHCYEVIDPQSVALMKNRLFLALPDGHRWLFIPFRQIAAVESLGNGRTS